MNGWQDFALFAAVLIPSTLVATRWATRKAVKEVFGERCRNLVQGFPCRRPLYHRGECRHA